ncbi:MAG: DNA-3-methyladenine glycosylase I [Clostridiales bacterium]|nr:DNA-3-methyladenine glycosylase I [Clostridiales bacterium]
MTKPDNLQANPHLPRCPWCKESNPLYIAYHDYEWGIYCRDDRRLYELFLLEGFQAGLSWETVLNKRENFRLAYDSFDIDKVCAYGEKKIEELMKNPGIIRHRGKIKASIENSRIIREIRREFGSFSGYLDTFTGGKVIFEPDITVTRSELSDTISSDMKRRGMKFAGTTIIYAFLQACGRINGHVRECFLYKESEK